MSVAVHPLGGKASYIEIKEIIGSKNTGIAIARAKDDLGFIKEDGYKLYNDNKVIKVYTLTIPGEDVAKSCSDANESVAIFQKNKTHTAKA